MGVKPIPDGFHTVTAHLILNDTAAAIDFYKKAFNAEEISRMPAPGGKIMHAMIRVGDSFMMLADEFPEMGSKSAKTIGDSPVVLNLYVENVDKVFDQAVAAGATAIMPVADQFWGDRYGVVKDPFGHAWSVATHKQDLTPEQIGQAAAKAFGG